MKRYLTRGRLVFLILLIIGGAFAYHTVTKVETPDWVTGTIEEGAVQEIVSVSGVLEAEGEASVSFPVTGVVDAILVEEGDLVTKDQTLATLEQDELRADRQDAYASLLIAQADRTELIEGPRNEEREVTASAVDIAAANLARVTAEENRKVQNAYRTLLSDDLEALPLNKNTEAAAPLISGTYTCDVEGTYTVSTFRSGAQSGYSYRLSGLESGTYSAYTQAPAPVGTCGLSIQFIEGESYGDKTWNITVPNTRGASYTSNQNAYALALQQRENAIEAAEQALEKARREQTLANAIPRSEALTRADAAVLQAEARLAAIDARIKERTLRAPFDAVVSDIALTQGEVSTNKVAMVLVASNVFELSVRIPEIDIAKLKVGQPANVRFDARSDEMVPAVVDYISEIATEIDGVAYFEAKLGFASAPEWFRSGLNADVHIIVDEQQNVLRIPKRFLITEGDEHYLLYPNGVTTERRKVELLFSGNDGFVALSGNIHTGDTIVAP